MSLKRREMFQIIFICLLVSPMPRLQLCFATLKPDMSFSPEIWESHDFRGTWKSSQITRLPTPPWNLAVSRQSTAVWDNQLGENHQKLVFERKNELLPSLAKPHRPCLWIAPLILLLNSLLQLFGTRVCLSSDTVVTAIARTITNTS